MITDRLSLTIIEDIHHLQLTAPPVNRTDSQFFTEFSAILNHLNGEKDVRGLIISSLGRHFSSGADIDELIQKLGQENSSGQAIATQHSLTLFNNLKTKPYPVVCAIQGCCLGSGLELALACHYRIATKNAFFSLPETSFELMPGCGGTVYLPQLIGVGKSIEMILGESNLLAEDARKIGLIDMVVQKGELLAMARNLIVHHGVHQLEKRK